MTIDALLPGGEERTLIWQTYFAGVTLGSPTGSYTFWTVPINGTDSITGLGFIDNPAIEAKFGPTANVELQCIATNNFSTTFADHFVPAINSSTTISGKPSAGEIVLRNLVCSTTYPEQTYLAITRSANSAYNADHRELYYTFEFKLPSGLAIDTLGEFKVLTEFKTGCADATKMAAVTAGTNRTGSSCASLNKDAGAGDFRFLVQLTGANSLLNELQVRLDNFADNGGSLTVPSAYWDETGYHQSSATITSLTKINYFNVNTGISCPLNTRLRMHVYYRLADSPRYQDRPTGVLQVMLEDLDNNVAYVLVNIENSYSYQLTGSFNLPISRNFLIQSYDVQNDVPMTATALQLWDKPPITF